MKVLHVCNDFCGSKVHAHLYKCLAELGVNQTVFTYFRDSNLNNRNYFDSPLTNICYCDILHLYHRFLYHLKIHDVYKVLQEKVDISAYDCVHAVTLFSDGALAYRVKKDYGKPYIVAVRNTDVNGFLGYAPHTWRMGRKILLNASKIIFISKALKEKFCKHLAIKDILPDIISKFVIQPNGIDDYWLDRVQYDEKKGRNILYVGRFDTNKNVVRLIKAVIALQKQYPDVKLNLVGGGGGQEKTVRRFVKNYPELIHYYGEIYDKNLLRDIYCENDVFAMPSKFETFGLVYIEALTQNLRLLYTKGQGIDGLFQENVGEPVNALSINSITGGIKRILENPNIYTTNRNIDFKLFRWNIIAHVYRSIYLQIRK